VPTVDDVWLNGIGGAIGAAVAWPVNQWLRTHVGSEQRITLERKDRTSED
jgi:hypothetical protein